MGTGKQSLRDFIKDHLVIGDGAMATQLYRLGVPVGVCYEELSVLKPEVVATVHRSYVEAGAQLIETNTFGAHRAGLERYGLEGQLKEINRAAVRLARAAAKDDAFVVGTIGSVTGARRTLAPPIDLQRAYAEQASALLEEDPDAILLETFLDFRELQTALRVVRNLTDKPIMAQLALLDLHVTRDGVAVEEAFRRLYAQGADVIGLNCRFGPADMQRVLQAITVPEHAALSVYPNAGLLSMTDGEYAYPSEPEYFAAAAVQFRALGVRIIGGCCGTTPDHVRAMAQAVGQLSPLAPAAKKVLTEKRIQQVEPIVTAEVTRSQPVQTIFRNDGAHVGIEPVSEKVRREYTVIVELDPPKDLFAEKFLVGAQALRDAGADAVTLADNSLAMTRMSNMALGALMKQRGVEPLLHISCRDRNLIGQQSHLMGLHALGISQILVVTGDPSRFGDLPGATSVFDVSSFDMIRMVKQLNQGIAFSGKTLEETATFVVGAAFNPHVRHFDKAIKRLERKVEAGADFIMTQPIFDPDFFAVLYDATKHLAVPIFVGVMPLLSQRNAEFLHNEVPGISLSQEARRRMSLFQGARAREEGVAIARELIDAAMEHFHGIYLITPLLRYEMTADLTRYVKEKAKMMHNDH
ncbi:bifunctional homocysteine S-methyltransferase/methylenetetrahydrofolate reductase [Sulfoacidibacillus thermotolerans]|uniref:Bifunctional homocysteine S-methyltransferase/methylenetetrahydrofolate reductase n=1 Tax=Sulfoacidibacillus thermotolerans TaxID=1765684 RepID=A0A2U3D9W1_SULT2|nr:bifunctional homocysteine S-methyltransferase/methylenetetrahydrofolate reductase [Sulfoacidibacillus thermotolerans]PWI58061.1 bifunctional homocysteine S-methyltransferase/methylenetetrahydrofolate reductase [Sulfoacidibacillus thermotolerans]